MKVLRPREPEKERMVFVSGTQWGDLWEIEINSSHKALYTSNGTAIENIDDKHVKVGNYEWQKID